MTIKKVFLPLFIGIFSILFIPFSSFAAEYQSGAYLASGNAYDGSKWSSYGKYFNDHVSVYGGGSVSSDKSYVTAVARVAGLYVEPGDRLVVTVTGFLERYNTSTQQSTLISYDSKLLEFLTGVRFWAGTDDNPYYGIVSNPSSRSNTSYFVAVNTTDKSWSTVDMELQLKYYPPSGTPVLQYTSIAILDFVVVKPEEDLSSVIAAIQEQTDMIEKGNAGTQSGINDFNSVMQDFNSELTNIEDFNNSIFDGFSDYSSDINSSISGFSFSSGLLSCATWFSTQVQQYFDNSGEFKLVFLLPFLLGVPYLIINLSRAERRSSRRRGGENSD